jgi:hypothetical protein
MLTIKYDEDTDTVEYMQEEVLVYKEVKDILSPEEIAKLTSEDMQIIMEAKDCGKA